jgi:hypothetical protein
MRIVIVNQVPSPPLLEVAEALVDRGHEVTLLAAASAVSRSKSRLKAVQLVEYDSRSAVRRLASWLAFTLQAVWKLSTIPGPVTIVASTNPPIMPLAAALVAWVRKCDCIVRVLDIYPDVLQATGFRRRRILARCLAWGSRRAYAHCRVICTLGDTMATTLAAYAPRAKIRVIPEWPRPCEPSCEVAGPTNGGPFVVLATGNVGLTHDIGPLVTASRSLSTENVAFVVSTSDHERISGLFAGCVNVQVVPRFNDLEYARAMLAAHAAFVSLRPGAEAASFPSRSLTYLAHGLPIIAVTLRPSDLASIVDKGPCGVVASPLSDGLEVAAAIRMLMGAPEKRRAMAIAAKDAATTFDPDRWRNEFVTLIEAGLAK